MKPPSTGTIAGASAGRPIIFEDGVTEFPQRDEGLVVVVPDTSKALHISVPLRNIGVGPAILTGLGLSATEGPRWSGQMTSTIVAPGELTRLNFTVPRDRPEFSSIFEAFNHGGALNAEVGYTDSAGQQTFRIRADLNRRARPQRPDPDWYVSQVFFYRGADSEPATVSAARDG